MRVLIVGAGIAGLSLAHFLKERGISYDLIDQTPEWRTIGYNMLVWPNGIRLLPKTVQRNVTNKGARITGNLILAEDGSVIQRFSFSSLIKRHGSAYQVLRDDLHQALRRGIKVRLNTVVRTLQQAGIRVHVQFSDKKKKSYDFVVGADGVDSSVRSHVTKQKPRFSGITGWLFWYPKKTRPHEILTQWGSGCFFGLYPHCKGARSAAYLAFATKRHLRTSNAHFVRRFAGMGGMIPEIIRSLPKKVYHHDHQFVRLRSWHKGSVVLIGDAAHCMPPPMGMGASLAIEDAFVLASELKKGGHALDRFEQKRRPRVEQVQKEARFIERLLAWPRLLYPVRKFMLKHLYQYLFMHVVDTILSERP